MDEQHSIDELRGKNECLGNMEAFPLLSLPPKLLDIVLMMHYLGAEPNIREVRVPIALGWTDQAYVDPNPGVQMVETRPWGSNKIRLANKSLNGLCKDMMPRVQLYKLNTNLACLHPVEVAWKPNFEFYEVRYLHLTIDIGEGLLARRDGIRIPDVEIDTIVQQIEAMLKKLTNAVEIDVVYVVQRQTSLWQDLDRIWNRVLWKMGKRLRNGLQHLQRLSQSACEADKDVTNGRLVPKTNGPIVTALEHKRKGHNWEISTLIRGLSYHMSKDIAWMERILGSSLEISSTRKQI